jgi:hypothetical protein
MDEIEAIKQLKARYFRLLDTKDWAGLEALFTPEVRVDTEASGGGVTEGAATFIASVSQSLDQTVTVHHGHMPEIDLTSPTTATGIWAMEDWLRFPAGGPFGEIHGFGHYPETYVKSDGAWRIASMRLTRLRLDLA